MQSAWRNEKKKKKQWSGGAEEEHFQDNGLKSTVPGFSRATSSFPSVFRLLPARVLK